MKICTKCSIEYPIEDFHRKLDSRASVCKHCCKVDMRDRYLANRLTRLANAKKYREENREEILRKAAKKRKDPKIRLENIDRCLKNSAHGCGLERKLLLIANQENRCAICDGLFSCPQKAFVDHDHDDGMIRGVLCASCNSGLGFFKDNINYMESAITYLDNCV